MIGNNTFSETSHDSVNTYFCYEPYVSSGQTSPSDALDSGTCSDLDGTPPPLLKKKNTNVSITLIGSPNRDVNFNRATEVESDDSEISIGGSLKGTKVSAVNSSSVTKFFVLPQTLLQDIRQRNTKFFAADISPVINTQPYEERKKKNVQETVCNTDIFYEFHINEHVKSNVTKVKPVVEDECFAGIKDMQYDGTTTIHSAKGTVRGVKNRVRAGIATFLQFNTMEKNYKEKEAGKVVVYTTTIGILRETYQACMKVKQILRTLLVKFEERDVFMNSEYQAEIQERMHCNHILVPQVFVDGQHVGDAGTIERLNEIGELRRLLKPYKSMDVCTTCTVCGGYRLLPCRICKGSKKSVHRNHFTAEFVALKCMNCDEVGLVRCSSCA